MFPEVRALTALPGAGTPRWVVHEQKIEQPKPSVRKPREGLAKIIIPVNHWNSRHAAMVIIINSRWPREK